MQYTLVGILHGYGDAEPAIESKHAKRAISTSWILCTRRIRVGIEESYPQPFEPDARRSYQDDNDAGLRIVTARQRAHSALRTWSVDGSLLIPCSTPQPKGSHRRQLASAEALPSKQAAKRAIPSSFFPVVGRRRVRSRPRPPQDG